MKSTNGLAGVIVIDIVFPESFVRKFILHMMYFVYYSYVPVEGLGQYQTMDMEYPTWFLETGSCSFMFRPKSLPRKQIPTNLWISCLKSSRKCKIYFRLKMASERSRNLRNNIDTTPPVMDFFVGEKKGGGINDLWMGRLRKFKYGCNMVFSIKILFVLFFNKLITFFCDSYCYLLAILTIFVIEKTFWKFLNIP